MRFFLPSVPIFSQNDSSFSSLRAATGGRGDFGLGDAIFVFLLITAKPVFQTMNYLTTGRQSICLYVYSSAYQTVPDKPTSKIWVL